MNFSPETGFSQVYERQVGERRTNAFSFLKGAFLTSPDMEFWASVILEKRLADNGLFVRLTIGPLFPQPKPIDNMLFLLGHTQKNIYSLLDGCQAEISFCPEEGANSRLHVDSLATKIISGMKGSQNRWLLDSKKGRPALRAVLEDPFLFWERYKKLVVLGYLADEVATG